ncbi:MAG: flagellar basal body L-ring protein FlgH, partial [Deltaproteobacteria bacterium]|nr:flagellar basal body L-ring protein FlgH [Deltaproteobacteria bacterium]
LDAMRRFTLIVLLFALLAGGGASGCAPAWKRGEEYRVSTFPEPVPQAAPAAGPSLWDDRGGVLFADRRARKVNDVVTIVVDETAKASKAANTSLSRDTKADLGISAFFGLEKSIASRNPNLTPAGLVKADGKNSFDGAGKTSREESLTTTVTAVVREILPNGNMVLEAKRSVSVNGENQVMVLHGIIRPEDVDGGNSVASSRVAQARIEYYGVGVVSEKQNPGWMAKILDHLWPF